MADVAVADEVTHLIITFDDQHGLAAESPQVPGFFLGRPTETEFVRDYRTVLHDIGVRGRVQAHKQTRGVTAAGREFLLRFAEGPGIEDRIELLDRVKRVLATEQADDMLDTETTPMGEVVFVAALPQDRLAVFMDQLYDDGDALVISASVAEEALFTMTLASGRHATAGWESLEQHGWTRETTISELLLQWARDDRRHRVLV